MREENSSSNSSTQGFSSKETKEEERAKESERSHSCSSVGSLLSLPLSPPSFSFTPTYTSVIAPHGCLLNLSTIIPKTLLPDDESSETGF